MDIGDDEIRGKGRMDIKERTAAGLLCEEVEEVEDENAGRTKASATGEVVATAG